jgi:hypothetical protein
MLNILPLLVMASSLGSNPDISQKPQMGNISEQSGQHSPAHQKQIYGLPSLGFSIYTRVFLIKHGRLLL